MNESSSKAGVAVIEEDLCHLGMEAGGGEIALRTTRNVSITAGDSGVVDDGEGGGSMMRKKEKITTNAT